MVILDPHQTYLEDFSPGALVDFKKLPKSEISAISDHLDAFNALHTFEVSGICMIVDEPRRIRTPNVRLYMTSYVNFQ